MARQPLSCLRKVHFVGAADPGPTDLSAAPSLSASGTTYEQFNFGNPNDTSFLLLQYVAP